MYICTITFRCGMYRVPGILLHHSTVYRVRTNDARIFHASAVKFNEFSKYFRCRTGHRAIGHPRVLPSMRRLSVVALFFQRNKQQQERAQQDSRSRPS